MSEKISDMNLPLYFLKKIKLLFIIIFLILNGISGEAQDITTPPTLPTSHPRLFILPHEISSIRSKINLPEFYLMKTKVYNSSVPACLAFKYLMEKNPEDGRNALNKAYNQLKATTTYQQNRAPFKSLFNAAIAFDYCYDLFNKGGVPSKAAFISELERVSGLGPSNDSWAPVKNDFPTLVGHFVEGVFYNQIIAGIAMHGDKNELYDTSAKFLINRIQKENSFWFPSHMHHQGSYIGARHSHTLLTALAFKTLTGGKNIFSKDLQYVAYHLLYFMRPDKQLIRLGDVSDDKGSLDYNGFVCKQTANYFNDPYLRKLGDQNIFKNYTDEIEEYLFELIYRPANAQTKPLEELPLTKYFPEPVGGDMIARTGWDFSLNNSSSAVVHMRIGNYYFGNHQHKDFGTFQIYYKGNLTGESGVYNGTNSKLSSNFWKNYQRSTIAHNSLIILDPQEKYSGESWTNTQVDGGTRWPLNNDVQPDNLDELLNVKNGYKYAEVIAHDFGPDEYMPEFSYLSGNLTEGYNYSNGLNSQKVKKVTRSMVTLNTNDADYPCIVIVFDRIEATNQNFKKAYLMHSINQPSVSGNKITIERGDGLNGKLVSYTLLPENPKYNVVKGYSIGNITYDPGTKSNSAYEDVNWRLEVSPSSPSLTDEFLHVMSTMNLNQNAPTAEKIINNNLVGAKILDKIIMFDREGTALTHANFQIRHEGIFDVLLCDLLPGEWLVKKDNKVLGTYIASKTGKNIYFKGSKGSFEIINLSYSDLVNLK